MSIRQYLKDTNREIKKHLGQYILVIVIPLLIVNYLLIPLYQWLAELILTIHGIPYLAHSTLPMFLTHPTAIVLLLILAGIIILTIFLMFCFTLIGIKQIKNEEFQFKTLIKESWNTLIHYGPKSIPGLLFYFILLMPAAGMIFHSSLFSKLIFQILSRS